MHIYFYIRTINMAITTKTCSVNKLKDFKMNAAQIVFDLILIAVSVDYIIGFTLYECWLPEILEICIVVGKSKGGSSTLVYDPKDKGKQRNSNKPNSSVPKGVKSATTKQKKVLSNFISYIWKLWNEINFFFQFYWMAFGA